MGRIHLTLSDINVGKWIWLGSWQKKYMYIHRWTGKPQLRLETRVSLLIWNHFQLWFDASCRYSAGKEAFSPDIKKALIENEINLIPWPAKRFNEFTAPVASFDVCVISNGKWKLSKSVKTFLVISSTAIPKKCTANLNHSKSQQTLRKWLRIGETFHEPATRDIG